MFSIKSIFSTVRNNVSATANKVSAALREEPTQTFPSAVKSVDIGDVEKEGEPGEVHTTVVAEPAPAVAEALALAEQLALERDQLNAEVLADKERLKMAVAQIRDLNTQCKQINLQGDHERNHYNELIARLTEERDEQNKFVAALNTKISTLSCKISELNSASKKVMQRAKEKKKIVDDVLDHFLWALNAEYTPEFREEFNLLFLLHPDIGKKALRTLQNDSMGLPVPLNPIRGQITGICDHHVQGAGGNYRMYATNVNKPKRTWLRVTEKDEQRKTLEEIRAKMAHLL